MRLIKGICPVVRQYRTIEYIISENATYTDRIKFDVSYDGYGYINVHTVSTAARNQLNKDVTRIPTPRRSIAQMVDRTTDYILVMKVCPSTLSTRSMRLVRTPAGSDTLRVEE